MNKNYKYIIFSPYFGKLPINFNLWLESCSYNDSFKFIIFTDDKSKFKLPENVEIIYLSFEELENRIQSKFDFKINLRTPYKLCDFKPTYGYVFSKYLDNCNYWGYCDLDLIFGDLKQYLPKNLEDYDKISYMGHFCMYRNNKNINEMFMSKIKDTIDYADILSSSQNFAFDEIGDYGINNIFKTNGLKIYDYQINVADVTCRKENFRVSKFENGKFTHDKFKKAFVFDNGKIIAYHIENKELKKTEYAYLHFQKRKMLNNVINLDKFIIKYNGFIDYFDIDKKNINTLFPSKYKPDLKWIKINFLGIKRRIKRTQEVKKILSNKRS